MDVFFLRKHPEFRVRSLGFPRRPIRTVTVLGVALLLTTGAVRTAVAGGFAAGASQNFTVATNPRAVVLGDVNNDGIQDMVAPSSSGAGVTVYRGLGGGAFAAAQSFAAQGLGAPALADLNGDGKLDFVATQPGNQFLIIYRGNGNGTFSSENVFGTPPNAEFTVTGDFNGDGKPDIATAGNYTPSTGTIRVWLNTTSSPGGITSFDATDYAVGAQARGIATAYNITGTSTRMDLVSANLAGSISILQNDGTGHFGNRQDIPTQVSCYAIAVGYLFGRGLDYNERPQIVTANRDSAAVSLLVYNTDTNQWVRQNAATAAGPRFVSYGDADGDGNVDIVVTATTGNAISILSLAYDGTSTMLKPKVDVPVASSPTSAIVVNFDGDLKNDLLCTRSTNNLTWIHGAPKVGWALGDTIPDFAAQNQDGHTFQLSSTHGRWVFLDFCSGWCMPCRRSMGPTTTAVYLNWFKHPTVSFDYITGLVDGDVVGTPSTRNDAIAWSTTYGISRPVLHSSDLPGGGMTQIAYNSELSATPTLRLVDPAGRIVWLRLGSADDTTINRVVANAAGVPVMPGVPQVISGTETVTYGVQVATSPADPSSGFTFPYNVTGFGENFTSDLEMVRNPLTHFEDWTVDLTVYSFKPGFEYLKTDHDWGITLSSLQLDPVTRTLPPGQTASLSALDTNDVAHDNLGTVPVSWSGGTLTLGPIPAALLAGLPPIRQILLRHKMGIDVWTAAVNGPSAANVVALRPTWPNPARNTSRIAWSQPRAGTARLDVFDASGRRVRTVANRFQPAGDHAETWNLGDDSGAPVEPGLYFVRLLVAGKSARTRRITVLR